MAQTTSELYDELVNKVRQYEMYISTKTLLNNIKHMENKQQTAVEWLFEKLWDEPKDKFTWYALRKMAIEMEMWQIEKAYKSGIVDKTVFNSDKSKTYYQETYDN